MYTVETQECCLIKTGRLQEYNSQFYNIVERGVFQKFSLQEMLEYKGPLNYITMVEALKNSPYTTTPLRICM